MREDLQLKDLSHEKEILINQLLISKRYITFIERADKLFKFFVQWELSHLL